MNSIDSLLGQDDAWLRDKTAFKQINNWVEITTPDLDRYNDYIQIYVKKVDGGFLLTDGGSAISEMLQCMFDSPKQQKQLKAALDRHSVTEEDGNLQVKATVDNFALKKQSLIQAILFINDMSCQTARPCG